jgi:hypothetical protein
MIKFSATLLFSSESNSDHKGIRIGKTLLLYSMDRKYRYSIFLFECHLYRCLSMFGMEIIF